MVLPSKVKKLLRIVANYKGGKDDVAFINKLQHDLKHSAQTVATSKGRHSSKLGDGSEVEDRLVSLITTAYDCVVSIMLGRFAQFMEESAKRVTSKPALLGSIPQIRKPFKR